MSGEVYLKWWRSFLLALSLSSTLQNSSSMSKNTWRGQGGTSVVLLFLFIYVDLQSCPLQHHLQWDPTWTKTWHCDHSYLGTTEVVTEQRNPGSSQRCTEATGRGHRRRSCKWTSVEKILQSRHYSTFGCTRLWATPLYFEPSPSLSRELH